MEAISEECLSASCDASAFLIDGGSTCHVVTDESICYDIVECNINVMVGGSNVLSCKKTGKCVISFTLKGKKSTITLGNVRIIPTFGRNIISEHMLQSKCMIVKVNNIMTVIADNGKGECLIEAPIVNKLCFLPDAKGVKDHVLIARQYRSTDTTDVELAHQRLGHINYQEAARIIGAKPPSKPAFCEACVQGKSTRLPIGSRSPTSAPLHAAPRPGYLLHTDCLGPLRVQSRSGKKYALLFIDDRSRRLFLFLLSSTDQVLPSFKHLTAYLEAEFGRDRVIAQLKSDCDPSCYNTTAFQRFLKQKGIHIPHIFCTLYSSLEWDIRTYRAYGVGNDQDDAYLLRCPT